MKLKPWQKNVLSAAIIAAVGYGLFLLMFLLAALVAQAGEALTKLISGKEEIAVEQPTWMVVFVILLTFGSWLILRSKLNDVIKAAYLPAPLMVAFVLTGIVLYEQPMGAVLGVGAVFTIAVLIHLFIRKLSWLYFFATVYTAGVALYMALAGVEL